jgi:hypothetical protein
MLSSAASLQQPMRVVDPRPRRRANLQEKNPNLFDLLLDETYPWQTLNEEHQTLAVQILARLIAQTALRNQEGEKNHE